MNGFKTAESFADQKYQTIENYGKSKNEPIFNILRWVFVSTISIFSIFHFYKNVSTYIGFESVFIFIVGILLADVFTGMIHFCLDNFSFKGIPFLEKSALLFQGHHDTPLKITQIPLSLVLFPPFVLMLIYYIIFYSYAFNYGSLFSYFTDSFTFVAGLSQLSHRLSHKHIGIDSKVNELTKVLRKLKIFVEPNHHAKHHSGQFNSNYAISNGLSDLVMNKLYYKLFYLVKR